MSEESIFESLLGMKVKQSDLIPSCMNAEFDLLELRRDMLNLSMIELRKKVREIGDRRLLHRALPDLHIQIDKTKNGYEMAMIEVAVGAVVADVMIRSFMRERH